MFLAIKMMTCTWKKIPSKNDDIELLWWYESIAYGFMESTTFHQPVNCFYYILSAYATQTPPRCEHDTWANRACDVQLCSQYLWTKPNHSTVKCWAHFCGRLKKHMLKMWSVCPSTPSVLYVWWYLQKIPDPTL